MTRLDPTPAEIARRLSPAQRGILVDFPNGFGNFGDWLGLAHEKLYDPTTEALTHFGLAVRAVLEQEARDE